MLMMPMVIPVLSISFCLTSPVEKAIALGGVEMGRHMALDAARAIPMMMVEVPPMAPLSLQHISEHTRLRRNSFAVFRLKKKNK